MSRNAASLASYLEKIANGENVKPLNTCPTCGISLQTTKNGTRCPNCKWPDSPSGRGHARGVR